MCKIAQELNLPSVMVIRKGVFSLFILLKLRSAVHVGIGCWLSIITTTESWKPNNLTYRLWINLKVLEKQTHTLVNLKIGPMFGNFDKIML